MILPTIDRINKDRLGLNDDSSEAECEARMTVFLRLTMVNNNLEATKYLDRFNTKRFDVLAISNSIIACTILSPLFAVLIITFFMDSSFREVSAILKWAYLLSNLFGIIIIMLLESRAIMREQIIRVNIDKINHLMN